MLGSPQMVNPTLITTGVHSWGRARVRFGRIPELWEIPNLYIFNKFQWLH